MPTTGMDLKLDRVRQRVSVKELAAQMGVTGARVSHIEALAVVTDEAVAKYRTALSTLAAVATSENPQEAA